MELIAFILIALVVAYAIAYLFKISLGLAVVVAVIAAIGLGVGELLLKGLFAVTVFGLNLFGGIIGFVLFLIIAIIIVKAVRRA